MSNFKSSLLISTLAAFISVSPPIFADGSNTYINVSIGKQVVDNGLLLETEEATLIGLEHRYRNGWGAEIFWMDSSPSARNNTGEIDLTQYGIDGLYYFRSDENNIHDNTFQPYGALGLVYADFKNDVGSDQETQLRAGLGLRVVLSDHWSVKSDARLIYSGDTSVLDNTFSVGLSYAFNSQSKKLAAVDSENNGLTDTYERCPNTPAGVKLDSTGCALDTDGDSVPNYADNCLGTPAGTVIDSKGCALDGDNDGVTDDKDNCPTTSADVAVDANGCKFVLTSSEEVTYKIYFGRNSNVITQDRYAEIEKLSNFLKKYTEAITVIEGHTDSRKSDAYNIKLSKSRAEVVKTVLIERFGIEANRVFTVGYGESRPIASNDTDEGRQANRRVVAVVKAQISD
ncbi:MAG: OOP family OmpA-OmpF porin [Urechidicola sp.]|jgi:OOP family OmpA-OmpF porin